MHEVDFLPVGEGERSGDAIAVRFQYPNPDNNNNIVVVIDGGYQKDGLALANAIVEHYGTNRIDLVVSTHADADHINGLIRLVELAIAGVVEIGELMLHQPWNYAYDYTAVKFRPGAPDSFTKSLDAAETLCNLAEQAGIPVVEPFTGDTRFDGILTVVGPDPDYYLSLVPQFGVQTQSASGLAGALSAMADAVATRTLERLDIETLTDDGEVSAKNNSSVILELRLNGQRLLFTGDAGQDALHRAVDSLSVPLDSDPLSFIQIPHHGSRRNVGPTILNRLLGEPNTRPANSVTAFVSASKDAPKHPARRVTNAFLRRGCKVCSTEGQQIRHRYNAPDRIGWEPLTPIPFYSEVEDDD
jgi:beta-lactamase superfamily II metal-dependent hydrolase